ncbi:MAG: hypothetical protein WAM73_11205 [Desulfobacterales bacterium]
MPLCVEINRKGRQSVYRWKDDNVKIKLKMNESSPEIKLGLYYSPLAEQLNEEQFENLPDDVLIRRPPESGEKVKTAPLLDK